MSLPGDVEEPADWTKEAATQVLHTSPLSLVERIASGVRKQCWGQGAADSEEACQTLMTFEEILGPFFVKVHDHVTLADDGKRTHMALLEPFDCDAFGWMEKWGDRRDVEDDLRSIVRFAAETHAAVARLPTPHLYTDIKLENLLIKEREDGRILAMKWGDVESLRPHPCSSMRCTLYYLPSSMVMPTVARNTRYLLGKKRRVASPHPSQYRRKIISHQLGVFCANLVCGPFDPVEVWWDALSRREIGPILLGFVAGEEWWKEEWSSYCQVSPFCLTAKQGMDRETFSKMCKVMEEGIKATFWKDLKTYLAKAQKALEGKHEEDFKAFGSFLKACFKGKSVEDLLKEPFLVKPKLDTIGL